MLRFDVSILLLIFAGAAVVDAQAADDGAACETPAEDPGADETCALQVARRAAGGRETVPFVPQCKVAALTALGHRQGPGDDFEISEELLKLMREDQSLPPPAEPHGKLRVPRLYPGTIYTFATLAEMSYCGHEGASQVAEWKCEICEATGFKLTNVKEVGATLFIRENQAEAYVGKILPSTDNEQHSADLAHANMKEGCLITVRGSTSAAEWLEDLRFSQDSGAIKGCPSCKVHHGFHDEWMKLWEAGIRDLLHANGCKPNNPAQHIYITGHSLGGAIATLGAMLLKADGYTIGGAISFEAPRVGNAEFQEFYNQELSSALLYRVTYHKDVVVHLPPRSFHYQHTQPEIYYNTTDVQSAKICKHIEDPSCSYQWWTYSAHDHCNVPYSRDCHICDGCSSPIFK